MKNLMQLIHKSQPTNKINYKIKDNNKLSKTDLRCVQAFSESIKAPW